MEPAGSGQVTLLLQRMREGDPQAAERLLPLVPHETRALARHYLKGERPGHALQPTALDFGGLSLEETAEALNVSLITVKRDWAAARAWLKGQVRPESLR